MFTLRHQQLFLLPGLKWSWAAFTFSSVPSLLSRAAPATRSSVCIMYSLTDKGIEKAILGLTLRGKWTVSFRVLPASFLEALPEAQASQPTQLSQSDHGRNWNRAHLSAWRNSASLNNFKMPNSEKKKAKGNSITQRRVIQCVDYSGSFSLLPPPSGTSP